MRVAVVGGGISGLSAAWELRGRADVTVFEPERLGGKIRTEPFEGRPVDSGPDAFITRSPAALELCRELGIDDLVSPAAGSTLLWHDGRLRRLPEGLVLGVPRQLGPLVRSGLLSPGGLARAAFDLVLPRRDIAGDVSVRDLVAGRFGPQIADRLVDPLVGGIHAGRISDLSAEAAVPQLLEAAKRNRSLLLGLRATAARGPGRPETAPMFMTPRGGLSELVDRLCGALQLGGVSFSAAGVAAVERDGSRWRVGPAGELFDGVVLACDHTTAARLLGPGHPRGLDELTSASVVLVTMGYAALATPAGINGVLIPAPEGWLMTACSFASSKWPHWAAPGRTILRVSAGRAGDDRALTMNDDQVVDHLGEEVGRALGTSGRPDTWRVSRWPGAFPQYRIGHGARVNGIEEDLRRTHPGVAVCGSSYHGVGIPACIASARRTAAGLAGCLARAA